MAKDVYINHNSKDSTKKLNDLITLRNKIAHSIEYVYKSENVGPKVSYVEYGGKILLHIPESAPQSPKKNGSSYLEYFKKCYEEIKEKYNGQPVNTNNVQSLYGKYLLSEIVIADETALPALVEKIHVLETRECKIKETILRDFDILLFRMDRVIRDLQKNKYITNNFIRAQYIHAIIRSHFKTSTGENDGVEAQSLNNESTIKQHLKIISQDEKEKRNFEGCKAAA